jgi:hypothetical protein
MAIFASTTTSGYSDPLKAMSIKALEARLAAQQAQQQQPDVSSMATIPGGIGHVLGVVGDRMAQGRNEAAVAAQKEELARTIAGIDQATGPNPQQLAKIAIADPEGYRQMLTQMAEDRRQKAQLDVTRANNEATVGATLSGQSNQAAMETARLDAAKEAAAEAARVQREAKIDEEQRLGNRPASDAAKIMQDVQSGKLSQEQGQALVDKLSAPSASEMKAGNEIQNAHLSTQGALNDLKEARTLLGPEGTGVRSGSGASAAQLGAKWIGGPLGMSDPQLTQKTERYNQIMSAEAITAMAEKLKGASTDYEMKQFIAIMNNPDADPKTKVDALNNMIAKAEAHVALQADQLKRAKVPVPAGPGGAAAAPADPVAAAQDAINKGASYDEVVKRFTAKGGDPAALKPRGP